MTAPNATPQQATVAIAVESSAVARSGSATWMRAGASSGSGQATPRPTAENRLAATKSAGKPTSGRRKNEAKVRKKQKFAAVTRAKQAVRVEGGMGRSARRSLPRRAAHYTDRAWRRNDGASSAGAASGAASA